MNVSLRPPTFNEMVANTQQRIDYRLARDDAARREIFKMRYAGYLRDGGIAPNPSKIFHDAWDDTSNALLLGMYVDGQLASSVRLHINIPDDSLIPAFEPFADVLDPLRAQAKIILDPTRFVIDERFARIGPEMPFLTLRLIAMAAEYFNVDLILATVRAEHAVMYKRICGHSAITEPRAYPLLAKKIVCMAVTTEKMREVSYARHPFLASTHAERAHLFRGVSTARFTCNNRPAHIAKDALETC